MAEPSSDYREEVYESFVTPVVTLCEALETVRTSTVNRKVVCKHLHSSVSFSASSLVREKAAALKGRYYSAIAQLASPLASLFFVLAPASPSRSALYSHGQHTEMRAFTGNIHT